MNVEQAMHKGASCVSPDAPVAEIAWEPGRVELTLATGEQVQARAAVVTVPLGVLQAPPDAPGAIRS